MVLQNFFSKWCVWRLCKTRESGKPPKIPVNPNTGGGARANDPGTFGTFEEAQRAHSDGGYAGLGVLMSSGAGVVCVDIDDCLSGDSKPNGIAEWALQNFKGYCEVSQSGKGLHFFMVAAKPPGCSVKATRGGGSMEIYGVDDVRFLCVTGRPYRESCGDVVGEQEGLDRLIEHYGFMKPIRTNGANPDTKQEADTAGDEHGDEEIISLLKRNNKRGRITRLLAGDMKDYANDHSGADLALAAEIAFYTSDPAQLERIFNTSELSNRDKWRERSDYRNETIRKAISSAKGYYWDTLDQKQAGAGVAAAYADKLAGGSASLQVTKGGRVLSTTSNALEIDLVNF